MDDLPEIIPVFPLPNFVLFPGVQVPLHIFEPRYRQMVADVATSHRIIGMMMLKGEWERDYHAFPDLYEIGCAGRISDLTRLPDGRFNLVLDGLAEFRVVREVRDRQYRQAEIQWCPAPAEKLALDDAAMTALRDLLITYLGEPAREVWRSLVEQRGLRDANLINFICFHLDVTPIEKQTLLEARGARTGCLIDVLTFRLEERKLGPGGGPPGSSGRLQ
ncbi:MAG: LON peptidase substrate-binding domain-containing protein [Candidatus Binataceae bacterium]